MRIRCIITDTVMAKWFKDFPTSLKTGSDRIRSASESGTQSRPKPVLTVGTGSKGSLRKNSGADSGGGGGVGSLLHGRNRKNSAIELGRNHSSTGSIKDGKIWEILIPGKSKKNTKMEGFEDHRTLRTTSLADAYMSRMIKVNDPKSSTGGSSPDSERAKSPIKAETVSLGIRRHSATLKQTFVFSKDAVKTDIKNSPDAE